MQFIPLVILPAIVGAAFSFSISHKINLLYLVLTCSGVILLHLGANAIDDAYDYENGVDALANSMFPPDFGGWKPLPRGLISLRGAKVISYALLLSSLALAGLFWYLVGLWAFVLGLVGVVLAVVYTAPPLKLDYRGLGLGEASIFFAFGPIPVLGSFFIQSGSLSVNAFLVSVPIGLMTVTILLDHDLIFLEVYREAKKLSLTPVLGRKKALALSLGLTLVAYILVASLVAANILPIWSLVAPIASLLILMRKIQAFARPNEPPPFYVPFAVNAMFSNWTFALLLAMSLLV
ncbi:MAG TPA: prenyltransferase [Nitrososphaerales archaeon]|nr:prenyltransferase [Nitrososphaerales archaeon]